jgi:hypothetical protein
MLSIPTCLEIGIEFGEPLAACSKMIRSTRNDII